MNNEEASKLFISIADPNRLTIIKKLTVSLHVSASEFLPLVTCKQATLSHHLNDLVEIGLLNSKKKGTKVFYSLNALKYAQLSNYFNKIDRINKLNEDTQDIIEEKPIYRVVDSPIIKDREEPNKDLPTFLL